MKNFFGIFGLIIGLLTFVIWYNIALDTFPNTPRYAQRIFYSGYFISASMFLYALSLNSKRRIKQLIWYGGSNFYAFLMLTYFLNWHLDILIGLNKIVLTIILTITSCILYYLFSYKS